MTNNITERLFMLNQINQIESNFLSSDLELLMAKFSDIAYKSIRKFKNSQKLFKEASLINWECLIIENIPSELKDKVFTALNKETKEAVIVFKGSEPMPSFDLQNIVNDWWVADLSMVIGKIPKQFHDTHAYLQTVKENIPDGFNVYMTGHSLGGSITQLLCAIAENKSINAYTYNAYGVKHLLPNLESGGFEISSDFSNISNFSVSADLVSTQNEHIGNVYVVKYDKNFVQTIFAIISELPKVLTDIPFKIKKSIKYYFKAINWAFAKINGHLMNNFINGFKYEKNIELKRSAYDDIFDDNILHHPHTTD